MDLYKYQPLQPGEIRLFHMHCSVDPECEIIGALRPVPLAACTFHSEQSGDEIQVLYTALSYAWATTYEDGSHLTDYMICDGYKLRITTNLKQALIRIRKLSYALRCVNPKRRIFYFLDDRLSLWIDAVCINQEDLQERSEQVQMTARIFEQSANLLIWLGELALDILGECQYDLLRRARKHEFDKATVYALSEDNEAETIDEKSVLKSILARPWFHRWWVIQEVQAAHSDRTHIVMGDSICPRENFERLLKQHDLLACATSLRDRHFSPYREISHPLALHNLYFYDKTECSDPRDYVFAIEHISRDRARIDVDYNKDVRGTYLGLVKSVALGITEAMEWPYIDIPRVVSH